MVDPGDHRQIAQALLSLLAPDGKGRFFDPVSLRQEIIGHFGAERFRRRIADFLRESSP